MTESDVESFIKDARAGVDQCRDADELSRFVAAWMHTAAFHARNEFYYRELLVQCGERIGEPAYICDDGSRSEDVLVAKIPELVADLAAFPH